MKNSSIELETSSFELKNSSIELESSNFELKSSSFELKFSSFELNRKFQISENISGFVCNHEVKTTSAGRVVYKINTPIVRSGSNVCTQLMF